MADTDKPQKRKVRGEIPFRPIKRTGQATAPKKPVSRMFTAAEARALDEAKEEKNYKKKDRIMQSGDKKKIRLMQSNLTRFSSGGDASCGCSSCMGESARGAGAAVKGTNFKGVF